MRVGAIARMFHWRANSNAVSARGALYPDIVRRVERFSLAGHSMENSISAPRSHAAAFREPRCGCGVTPETTAKPAVRAALREGRRSAHSWEMSGRQCDPVEDDEVAIRRGCDSRGELQEAYDIRLCRGVTVGVTARIRRRPRR